MSRNALTRAQLATLTREQRERYFAIQAQVREANRQSSAPTRRVFKGIQTRATARKLYRGANRP